MAKFDWLATESAPEGYPMEIVEGQLHFADGEGLYLPSKKTLHGGWGKSISSHVVGPDLKPLPRSLEIVFFSYTENKFYSGDFKLPYDDIVELFKTGYYSPKEKKSITYHDVMVGVAPGGAVAVWLLGIDRVTEVFFGQAREEEIDWRRINNNPEYSREEYVRLEIEDSLGSEEIDNLLKNGIPTDVWAGYRKRYRWNPVFTNMQPPELIDQIDFFNGERDYIYLPLNDESKTALRAIPKKMRFIWTNSYKVRWVFEIVFNEGEIISAFEKLGRDGQPIEMTMSKGRTAKGDEFFIHLSNEKERIPLDNIHLESFRPSGEG